VCIKEVIKITIPALKYFLKHGLEGVKGLPESKLSQLRIALALNWLDKDKFIQATKGTGIDPSKLDALWDSETHLSAQMAGLETAKATGMGTKVWQSSGSCPNCQKLHGETVAINQPFSNGSQIAHGHDACQCSTSYKKDKIEQNREKNYSRGEIAEMSPAEYSANRDRILEQYASGKLK
jgi:hypothetical protein